MSLSYVARLLCVSFASFFVVVAALSALTEIFARGAIRAAGRAKLSNGMRALVTLRLAPACAGVLAVLLLCVPSYLWLEPAATREEVGVSCCIAAALGILLCLEAFNRVGRAIYQTRRFTRLCFADGDLLSLEDGRRAIVVNSDAPVLTLAGVFRPRLVASRSVLEGLSRDELAAAMKHERAHGVARDNLRRLLLLAAPRVPFFRGSRELESTWSRWSEWAADDYAAESDPNRSLALASALVRMARLGVKQPATPLCANFVSSKADLEQRVDRLLRAGCSAVSISNHGTSRRGSYFAAAAVALSGALIGVALAQPATLQSVHELLERFIH